jgi:hypothetical protein
MIQRVVLVRLEESFRTDESRAQIAEHTREVLGGIELVRSLHVGVPADPRTRREWDLAIVLQLESLEAVEEYRDERTHRAYVDVYLKPMMEKIRAWNFEL